MFMLCGIHLFETRRGSPKDCSMWGAELDPPALLPAKLQSHSTIPLCLAVPSLLKDKRVLSRPQTVSHTVSQSSIISLCVGPFLARGRLSFMSPLGIGRYIKFNK
uniref:Uncharacterized protein n=1 Tax=Sphaerodactylus townsendi TaxID=933632 RepID=A0ACB8F7Y6_9SAUR